MLQIAEAYVLLVATKVCEADEPWVDDASETFGAAAVLHVGPTGFADGGHVEAVATLDEVLLGRAKEVPLRPSLLYSLLLAATGVFQSTFFDEGREGQFLKATPHSISRFRQVDSLPTYFDYSSAPRIQRSS